MQTTWLYSGVLIVVIAAFVAILRWRRKGYFGRAKTLNSDLQLGAVPTYRSTLKQLTDELARVRRYHRPLSIVVLRLESDQLLVDLKRSLVAGSGNGGADSYNQVMQTIQLVLSLVGSILKESLRESDIACYDVPNNQYIIMLPESTREQATMTVTRLKKLLFKRTAGHLVAGIAEFPADGLIVEDLVKLSVQKCTANNNGQLAKDGQSKRMGSQHKRADENSKRK